MILLKRLAILFVVLGVCPVLASEYDGEKNKQRCYHIDVPSDIAIFLGTISEKEDCAETYRQSQKVKFHHTMGIIYDGDDIVDAGNFLLHIRPLSKEHDPKLCILAARVLPPND
jgi:hypothetical protein